MKLSAKTISNNCKNIDDVNAGIAELRRYFAYCEKNGIEATNASHIRYGKLIDKRDKLT